MEFCESCILGKSHKLKFAKATHTSKRILEYVHFDLWGSSQVPFSLNGSQYLNWLGPKVRAAHYNRFGRRGPSPGA